MGALHRPGLPGDMPHLEQRTSASAIGGMQQIGEGEQPGRHAVGIQQQTNAHGEMA